MDTIDDLILYVKSEEKHALDFRFLKISFNDDIFHNSKIDFYIIMQWVAKN